MERKALGFGKKKPDGYDKCSDCDGIGRVQVDQLIPKNSDKDSSDRVKVTENCPNPECFYGYVQNKDDSSKT